MKQTPWQRSLWLCAALLFCGFPLVCTAQATPAAEPVAPAPAQNGTVLADRPGPDTASPAGAGSAIRLDVVVTDKSGKPISGLDLKDFTILDNKQPGKILSFHAHDGTAHPADLPVEAILLFDTVNTGFDAVSYTRQQVGAFLRQNGGHLPVPMSIAWLTNDRIDLKHEHTTDGNALAEELSAADSRLRSITRSAGAYGAIERFELSTRMLDNLATGEVDKPGRKLLIWAGPGWPMLDGPNINISGKGQQSVFSEIVRLSTVLRLARIDLYSISQGMPDQGTFLYESFLKGVRKVNQANIPNLGLKVLAIQSGGLVLAPTNDVTGSINTCLQDSGVFYTLTFEPPPADGPNEYHELQVHVARPGLTARTSTGYYNQPDRPPAP